MVNVADPVSEVTGEAKNDVAAFSLRLCDQNHRLSVTPP